MASSAVDRLYIEFTALLETVNVAAEPSLAVTANDVFRKALLLAAASEFELAITQVILAYAESIASPRSPLVGLVRSKVLARQYHSFFKWDGANANQFFSIFGSDFKKYAEGIVNSDEPLADSIVAFLRLGEDRNLMVHEGFGTYVLNKTTDEIYQVYKRASVFVERIPTLLGSFQM